MESRNALSLFVNENKGSNSDISKEEILQAQETLAGIDKLVKLNNVAQNIYFGISLGSVLLLAAIGLAITFGVMGVINMAHGEMIMLGAYTTFVITSNIFDGSIPGTGCWNCLGQGALPPVYGGNLINY